MEISKALQEEIISVQNKLKNAIRDHQICVVKLKDDPNNTDILDRIREIQLHIVSLGRWQKQVVQRLRKEVESYKAENALNGARVSVATLLGLNNNNRMTNNNDVVQQQRRVAAEQNNVKTNGINCRTDSRASSKEDYEEICRNGDVDSPLRDNNCVKDRRSSSIEPRSGDDDIVEVPTATSNVAELKIEDKPKALLTAREQQCFLGCLGLITSARLIELQNKRAERKRRSTANSHFVYTNWEVPMKRKRHDYLQSLGSGPQTRQTAARLNGPSPPPPSAPVAAATPPIKNSVGRPPKLKSLIQAKANAAKANVLQNGDGKQSKDFYNKPIKQEILDKSSIKVESGKVTPQSTGKTVHIPGLPSGLTIERIENDSTICITCRNPGTLTVCEYCSSKFHISCHTIVPASTCYCPKCAAYLRSKGYNVADTDMLRRDLKGAKKEKDMYRGTTGYASRAFGKARENSEIHKSSIGLYKNDAVKTRQQVITAASLGINQLPSSTFLIPISNSNNSSSSNNATSTSDNSSLSVTAVDEQQSQLGVSTTSFALGSATATVATSSRFFGQQQHQQQQQQSKKQSSILLSQLSQPSIAAVSAEPRLLQQTKEIIPNGNSFLVIEKVPELGQRRTVADRISNRTKQAVSVLSYGESNRQRRLSKTKKSSNYVTVEVICNNDDNVNNDDERNEVASENSPDCVYLSEGSSGAPEVVELGSSPRPDDPKQQEPEVLNVSSGSSRSDVTDLPEPVEQNEITTESTGSSEGTASADQSEVSNESNKSSSYDNRIEQSVNDNDDNFLRSIFPGRYGYKIDIVDLLDSSTESHTESHTESQPTSPERQPTELQSELNDQQQQRGYVKLEETHLSTSPRTELTVTTKFDDDDDVEMISENDENITVPDNKSDDAAQQNNHPDDDNNENLSLIKIKKIDSASETATAD